MGRLWCYGPLGRLLEWCLVVTLRGMPWKTMPLALAELLGRLRADTVESILVTAGGLASFGQQDGMSAREDDGA